MSIDEKKHPIQPIVTDAHGVIRFKGNAIVRHLLDHGGIDLNAIAMLDFTQDDREQFTQLIGYSLSGAHDLDYVSDECIEDAEAEAAPIRAALTDKPPSDPPPPTSPR